MFPGIGTTSTLFLKKFQNHINSAKCVSFMERMSAAEQGSAEFSGKHISLPRGRLAFYKAA